MIQMEMKIAAPVLQPWLQLLIKEKNEENVPRINPAILANRETFNFVLNKIHDDIVMSPTNLKPFPTLPDQQLAMTLYRFATGYKHSTLSNLFGVSVSAQISFLIKYVESSLPNCTISLFIYHLQMRNGKQRSVGFFKTMNFHVLVDGMTSIIISVQN